jgi:ABC-type multidrug transport system fused ATPase/permease subunit
MKLDGNDITHLAANELRLNFGVVPQETVLFSGTVYDNLIAARPHATFEQVVKACQAVCPVGRSSGCSTRAIQKGAHPLLPSAGGPAALERC